MKRKILLVLLSAVAIAAGALSFSACGKTSENAAISLQTAYASAAAYGYTGTVESFTAEISANNGGDLNSQIKSVELNSKNEIIVTFTDGSKANLGVVTCTHNYGKWTIGFEPSCTSIGYNVRECTVCGDKDYEFLPAEGHTARGYVPNLSVHNYVCGKCGITVQEAHSFEGNVCTACGYEADYTVGLTYKYIEATNSYAVSGNAEQKNNTEIIIPEAYNNLPVTVIYGKAFYGFDALESVIMPDSITEIKSWAFRNAENLKSFKLSANLKKIGGGAFINCLALSEIELPDGLETIESGAFGHSGLTSIVLPESLTTIKEHALSFCTSMTSAYIPASIKNLGRNVFRRCYALQNVELAYDIKTLGAYVFAECESLTSIEIPETVTEIGSNAFYKSGLRSIKLPAGLTEISAGLFRYCGDLTSVEIPDGVTSIGNYAFQGCTSLKELTIPASVKEIGSDVFRNCGIEKIVFEEGVTELTADALKNCENLTEIVLPESLTSIAEGALLGCTALYNITYGGTMAQWKAVSKASGWRTEDNIITDLTVTCSDGVLEYIW